MVELPPLKGSPLTLMTLLTKSFNKLILVASELCNNACRMAQCVDEDQTDADRTL